MQPHIVGVRFRKIGKTYHFDASDFPDIIPSDFVVVETSRGMQLGQVVQVVSDPSPSHAENGAWKKVTRKATARDLALRQIWESKEIEALINCREKASEVGKYRGVKFIAAEFSFDGRRLVIMYHSGADERLDLLDVRKAISRQYSNTHVEMRQIGPRDVAKILGGLGACGLENRCCSRFLTEFSPISIKMAKSQGISLNPTEITGMCGRLRCCLLYEYEQYVAARKTLPKRGKQVVTPLGRGKVVDILPLKQAVVVSVPDQGRHEFLKHEIQPWDELEALRRKAEQPCEIHGEGECSCGRKKKQSKV